MQVADDRARRDDRGPGGEALHEAETGERQRVGRERAQRGGDRVDHEPDEERPAPPSRVAERAEDELAHGDPDEART